MPDEFAGWKWRCAARVRVGSRCTEIAEPPNSTYPWFIPLCRLHQGDLDYHYELRFPARMRPTPDFPRWRNALRAAGVEVSDTYIPDEPGTYVYFVRRNDGRIKIGFSKDVGRRKRDLESAAGPLELLLTLPGDYVLEQALHNKFKASHAHGEWFNPSADLLEYIRNQGGVPFDSAPECNIEWKKGGADV